MAKEYSLSDSRAPVLVFEWNAVARFESQQQFLNCRTFNPSLELKQIQHLEEEKSVLKLGWQPLKAV